MQCLDQQSIIPILYGGRNLINIINPKFLSSIVQKAMKFLESYNKILEALQSQKTILIIFADPELLAPSESLIKYFTFNNIGVQLADSIFISKASEIKIYQNFNVLQFPQVTVITQSSTEDFKVLYNFIGCNQQKSWQALSELSIAKGRGKPYRKLNLSKNICPSSHKMKFINQIDEGLYKNGCFSCDGCKMLSHVEIDKPILHCQICQYDLCYACSHEEVIN